MKTPNRHIYTPNEVDLFSAQREGRRIDFNASLTNRPSWRVAKESEKTLAMLSEHPGLFRVWRAKP